MFPIRMRSSPGLLRVDIVFTYKSLPYNPAELIPIARVSNTILAVAVKADAPYNNVKEFTEAARAAPGKFNSGLVQGITELTFWGYQHHEKLQIAQVPYRDVNVAPVDLGEGRIQVVMSALASGATAVARRPHQADRRDQQKPREGGPRRPDRA